MKLDFLKFLCDTMFARRADGQSAQRLPGSMFSRLERFFFLLPFAMK